MRHVKSLFYQSKIFRIILVLSVVYTGLRVTVQGLLLTGYLSSTDFQGDTEYVWRDLQVYLEASQSFQAREDLYFTETAPRYPYPYAPAFALAYTPLTWFSFMAGVHFHTFLHILAYIFLYFRWKHLFNWLHLKRADEIMAWTLPIWLISSAFWNDLNSLNIGVYMVVLSTLLIEAILKEDLGGALLWLSVILQIKPHWSFAAAVPLLLGKWRFWGKLVGGSIIVYVAIIVLIALVAGPMYSLDQHADYVRRLLAYRGDFPWRTPADTPILGFNHSLMQTIYFFFGISPETTLLTKILKILLLLPLVGTCVRFVINNDGQRLSRSTVGLDLAFALYLGVFIWLDVVWEISLGIVVFSYLLITTPSKRVHTLILLTWLPYALNEIWQLIGLAVLGREAFVPSGFWIITNPNIYVPTMLAVLVTFYILLVPRLWTASGNKISHGLANT